MKKSRKPGPSRFEREQASAVMQVPIAAVVRFGLAAEFRQLAYQAAAGRVGESGGRARLQSVRAATVMPAISRPLGVEASCGLASLLERCLATEALSSVWARTIRAAALETKGQLFNAQGSYRQFVVGGVWFVDCQYRLRSCQAGDKGC